MRRLLVVLCMMVFLFGSALCEEQIAPPEEPIMYEVFEEEQVPIEDPILEEPLPEIEEDPPIESPPEEELEEEPAEESEELVEE